MEPSTLVSLLQDQKTLVEAAALALPHKFDKCTYELGSLKQAVYLCITCAVPRGLCQACSISCHGDHEQIELFPKRNFRCDCPTKALTAPCKLSQEEGRNEKQSMNSLNTYGQNFEGGGRFCRCHSLYDAEREREVMVQCLACEDWFHESCLNLRERIPPREPGASSPPETQPGVPHFNETPALDTSVSSTPGASTQDPPSEPDRFWDYENDDDEQDPDIPPALVPASKYDALICGECVRVNPMLRKWAGQEEFMMVIRNRGAERWRILDGVEGQATGEVAASDASTTTTAGVAAGQKRSREETDGDASVEPPTKKPHIEPSSTNTAAGCKIPTANPIALTIFAELDRIASTGLAHPGGEPSAIESTGDVFLTQGWRERWCKCSNCLLYLSARSYLEEEEEMFEPPEDPDAGLSLEELGMRALEKLPKEQAINGIMAFQRMSAELSQFLAPFAANGQVVTREDVQRFFEEKKRQSEGRQ